MPATPGAPRSRSNTLRKNCCGAAPCAAAPCSLIDTVSLFANAKPALDGLSVRNVRTISAAPTSRINDRPIWQATRTCRVLWPPRVAVRDDVLRSSMSDGEVA